MLIQRISTIKMRICYNKWAKTHTHSSSTRSSSSSFQSCARFLLATALRQFYARQRRTIVGGGGGVSECRRPFPGHDAMRCASVRVSLLSLLSEMKLCTRHFCAWRFSAAAAALHMNTDTAPHSAFDSGCFNGGKYDDTQPRQGESENLATEPRSLPSLPNLSTM